MLKLAENTLPLEEPPADGFDPSRAIGLSQARLKMRGQGATPRPPDVSTVRRWIMVGCRPAGPHGPLLKLQARRWSGQFLTMPEWVDTFEAERVRLSQIDPLADVPTNRRREAEKRAAAKYLDERGVGTSKADQR